jgi:hypothetical protein
MNSHQFYFKYKKKYNFSLQKMRKSARIKYIFYTFIHFGEIISILTQK